MNNNKQPISKKQLNMLKFGNYFSKSKAKQQQQQSEEVHLSITNNKDKQLSDSNHSTSTIKRLSNSAEPIPHSHSTSKSLEEEQDTMPNIFFPPNFNKQQSINTRCKELLKAYDVDTDSTVSTSDIRDDVSSVASDEPSSLFKKCPRNAPPPPPLSHIQIHSKSAFSTPNGSPYDNSQALKLNDADRINPFLDFSAIDENKSEHTQFQQLNGLQLPPPPISPSIGSHSNKQRKNSKTMHHYRKRTNSLPFYETPKTKIKKLIKSQSVCTDDTQFNALSHGRTQSEDIKKSNHAYSGQRVHYRAKSARNVTDLSLSEKLYQNRRTVLNRLSRGKNKKDVMSKLDISIGKVEEKLKIYVKNLASLQEELIKNDELMQNELNEWEKINNFSLCNLCRSYYSNFKLFIVIRIEIATAYCECFRDKYRQLKKVRDRIKKDAKKYSLNDLVLTVEAAMMTASNIRLPQDINVKRDNEKALSLVIKELKKKYAEKKYEDVVQPMSAHDRTKHILTMLVQIIDTSNQTTTTKNVSDGLPYFHPMDNGYQVPFEQLLYDPRFDQNESIQTFISKYCDDDNNGVNVKVIEKEKLSLAKISTFIYKLTNSFLDSCELNKGSPFFQKLFWDCTNLMIGRSIFPKFERVINYVLEKDVESVENDQKFKKQLVWMSTLSQKKIGIEDEFCYFYQKKMENEKFSRKGTVFVDEECENEEKIAYYAAILRLKSLSKVCVPQDSIVCVIDSIHDIQKAATKYSKMKQQQQKKTKKMKKKEKIQVVISGDSLFPIVVYCLVQSGVDCWNKWMFMMRKFYTQKILSFGQTGFCFSLINAAVTYILQQKPSNFGLDDDLL